MRVQLGGGEGNVQAQWEGMWSWPPKTKDPFGGHALARPPLGPPNQTSKPGIFEFR